LDIRKPLILENILNERSLTRVIVTQVVYGILKVIRDVNDDADVVEKFAARVRVASVIYNLSKFGQLVRDYPELWSLGIAVDHDVASLQVPQTEATGTERSHFDEDLMNEDLCNF